MPIAAGTRLGPYEIVAPLGAGGMGEVYKARDTRLDRTVAVKVLSAHLADNQDVRQRFEREARAVSSLNHPHICTLYDVGNQDGVEYLIMEFLEGETLAARIGAGALPFAQVLEYAVQIADALSQAHRHGVLHRDLKPGNIMLTRAGAKLLDFGLAKLRGIAAEEPSPLTTLTRDLTQKGAILGTLQYMSPEQLDGREADARSDIFAFGAVLYEMAAGRKAFEAKGQASLIAAIMGSDPPTVSAMQPAMPASLDRVIQRCLAKDPDDRWQTARDLTLELRSVAEGKAVTPAPVAVRPLWPRLIAAGVVGALLAVAATVAWFRRAPAEPPAAVRFFVSPPEKTAFAAGAAISPDGRRMVAPVSGPDYAGLLWIREMDSLTGRLLPGTERATNAFWSPDSRSIAFFADGKLKRVDISGGPPQTLCDAPLGQGGSWSRDGVILFSRNIREPLYRVAQSGGPATPVTALDQANQEITHRWPWFLPDGRHFLYFSRSGIPEKSAIYAAALDSKDRRRLLAADSSPAYAPPDNTGSGYILFRRETALMAQPFDARRLSLTGDPFPVADPVSFNSITSRSVSSVSDTGVLTFLTSSEAQGLAELVWHDRSGKPLGAAAGRSAYFGFRLSPDQKHVAVARIDTATRSNNLWMIDFARGIPSRFTFPGATIDRFAVWSPDGSRILFGSYRDGPINLYQKLASGEGNEEAVLKTPIVKYPWDWSADGRYVVYSASDGRNPWNQLWLLPWAGDRKPQLLMESNFNKMQAQFSPDGRWIAYHSNESGIPEIYVRRFNPGGAGAGGKWQISTGGGVQPRWRRDGKELFYIAVPRMLMAAEVRTAGNFEALATKPLFQVRSLPSALWYNYDVSADGQRFLVQTDLTDAPETPLTVVLNWTAGLKR